MHKLKGTKQKLEHVKKRIESRRRNGTLRHTALTKSRMSFAHKGKKQSTVQITKRSEAMKRFYSKPENRKMLSEARKKQWQNGFKGLLFEM